MTKLLVAGAFVLAVTCPAACKAGEPFLDMLIQCDGGSVSWFHGGVQGDRWSRRLFPHDDLTCSVSLIVEDPAIAYRTALQEPSAPALQLLILSDESDGITRGNAPVTRATWSRLAVPDRLIASRVLTPTVRAWGSGFQVSSTVVLPYSSLPRGHAHLALFVPADLLGEACKPSIAGYLSQFVTVLANPPRNVAEEDWALLRHAMREQAAGRPAEAERIARTLLIAHPLHSSLIAYLAELVEQQERLAEAAALYREAARIGRAGLDTESPHSRMGTSAWPDKLDGWEGRAAQLEARAAPR